ncbi:MAG TPA: coproporphyrinogen III oxidase family protein [Chlorobium sp.]|uniref:Heme chaperone HemW n=2 Tax=Chlorobium phaeovibrioides TaxID=1094 RepID=A4SCV1_CHLPM|nr:coproporphyrinogen III oxidase family protein [Chlorobium sp.]
MLSLYVHIPFCRKRCSYCDFYLVAGTLRMEDFFVALRRETASRASLLKGQTIGAIHFGGGTPSMASPSLLGSWLEQVASLASFAPDMEIALEANPEDLKGSAANEFHQAGVNRLSLGVQSFSPEKLSSLGRAHSPREAMAAARDAVRMFDSVSLDLICGVPGEDRGVWQDDLERAKESEAQHVSVYMLSLEPRTLLSRDVSAGRVRVPDEGEQAGFYMQALKELKAAGYGHYEVSNFAMPGCHSRYNLASWKREPYIGYGPSAHSFLRTEEGELRTANEASLSRYLSSPQAAEGFREVLGERERFEEQVFLSLRINSGLSIEFLRKGNTLPNEMMKALETMEERGWIRYENGTLYLTDPGFLFADLIAAELIP